MKSLDENFTQAGDQEKIKFIKENATHISNFLKKQITKLKSDELSEVVQLAQVESSAEKVLNSLNKNLQDFIRNYGSGIDIDPKILKPEQINKIDEIYKNTIIKSVIDMIESINDKDNIAASKNVLYSQTAMNQASMIFDSVNQFKNQVNEVHPDLTSTILTIATPALACLIGPHAPLIAAAVLLAPIAISVTKLLIENIDFKSIFDKFFKTIDKLRGNEKLNEIYQVGEKVVEIAQVLDTSVSAISKFNCTKEGAKEMLEEMKKNSKIKEVMGNIADFADKLIPSSKAEFKAKIDSLVSDTLVKFKEAGVNTENLEKIKTVFNKHVSVAKDKIEETLQQGNQIFTKISGVVQIAQELSKPEKMIDAMIKIAGIDKNAVEIIAKNFTAKANNNFNSKNDTGTKLSPISKAIKDPLIQNFAKEQLGFNNASKLLLESASPDKRLSQAMVRR